MKKKDLTGQRFGRLTVVDQAAKIGRETAWNCVCVCGGTKRAATVRLLAGQVLSCGCLRAESARKCGAMSPGPAVKHGESIGGRATPEARSWYAMWNRCTNSSIRDWRLYGGRGITVCDRWKSLALFVRDMGRKPTPRHSIDRIDPDGNYEPTNCRWATPREQQLNRRNRKC